MRLATLLLALLAHAHALRISTDAGRQSRREALAKACTSVLAIALPASASYGQMADFAGSGVGTTSAAEMAFLSSWSARSSLSSTARMLPVLPFTRQLLSAGLR